MKTFNFSTYDNLKRGLPLDQWKSLESALKSAGNPSEFITQFSNQSELADKALEAGRYELAAALECSSKLLQIKALLFSSGRESAIKVYNSIFCEEEKIIADILLQRTNGQSLFVYEKYTNQLDSIISGFASKLQIEARIQWASVLFSLERWDEVISQYKMAYDLSEKENLHACKAILAFNLSTAYFSKNQNLESKTWLWVCQKELSNYQLDSLKKSVELFEIQVSLKELNFNETIRSAQTFLSNNDLSPIQKIRALHALAEAQCEWGLLLDAEMTLSLSHKTIQQSQYPQFNQEQDLIEQNLSSLVHRSFRSQNKKKILASDSLKIQFKAAEARKAFKFNDIARTLRLTVEIKKSSEDFDSFDDLFVLLSHRLEHPGKRARTLEHQILKSWLAKQWKALDYIKTHLEIECSDSPWKKCLSQLTSGISALLQKEMASAKTELLEAYHIAKNSGLERLESLLIVTINSFQFANLPLPYSLSPQELAFIDSLLSKIKAEPITYAKNQEGQIKFDRENSDLIFDEDRNELTWQNQTVSLVQQPVLKRILKLILQNSDGISKEQLVQEVWGFDYHPLNHDPMIYSAIGRLRDLIPITMQDGLYRVPQGLKWVHLSQDRLQTSTLSSRQKLILKVLEANGSLSRKDVVQHLGISERTALRELVQLVNLGLLKQSGSGRGVHYLKWNQGA